MELQLTRLVLELIRAGHGKQKIRSALRKIRKQTLCAFSRLEELLDISIAGAEMLSQRMDLLKSMNEVMELPAALE